MDRASRQPQGAVVYKVGEREMEKSYRRLARPWDLRGRVRGGFAFPDAGRPAFIAYLLAAFRTACQATVRLHVLRALTVEVEKTENNPS